MRPARFAAPARFLIALAMLALLIGGCRTLRRPDAKTDPNTQKKSEPDSKVNPEKPLLTGRIENLSMYVVPNHREDLAISLIVTVRNMGSPSTAGGWGLEVNSPGRRVPAVLEPVHVNGVVEMPGANREKSDRAREDLALKAAKAPIAKENPLKGVLTFVLPRTAESELSNNNTSFTVHFKDAQSSP